MQDQGHRQRCKARGGGWVRPGGELHLGALNIEGCSRVLGLRHCIHHHSSVFVLVFKRDFSDFLCTLFNAALSAAPQIPLCRRMLGFEPRTVATSGLAVRRSRHSLGWFVRWFFKYFNVRFSCRDMLTFLCDTQKNYIPKLNGIYD